MTFVCDSVNVVSSALWQRLAQNYGVATHYANVFGQQVAPPDSTLQAVLAALGVIPQQDSEAEAWITQRQDADWSRALPPVVVVRCDSSYLTVRAPLHTSQIEWLLTTEEGETKSGQWILSPTLFGQPTHTLANGSTWVEHQLTLFPALQRELAYGYHTLAVTLITNQPDPIQSTHRYVRVPNQCYQLPAAQQGYRSWGVALQLYAQRSATNAGMGTWADLAGVAQWLGQQGADLVGMNPMHALFPSRPKHISPYSPSSRRFLNTLYIDLPSVPEWSQSQAAQALWNLASDQRAAWVASDQVPYEALGPWHQRVLNALFDTFLSQKVPQRMAAFEDFCNQQGPSLWQFALFQVLSEVMDAEAGRITCWWEWPAEYQTPQSPAIQAFGERHALRIRAVEYAQFVAWEQLTRAHQAGQSAGMALGLYGDLAVGSDVSGFDVWSNPELIASGMSVGCPPDACNLLGQNWGLPPWRPDVLEQQAFEPLIQLLRANMAVMGAIRIDHAMCLMRLFWIPQGKTGAEGTYVHYPLETLMALVALESYRNQCVVIGEDLGTVPPEITGAFERWGVLSYKLLLFEREGQQFVLPQHYPSRALAAFSTHDLPTLPGFWQGEDIQVRQSLGLYPNQAMVEEDRSRRPAEKQALIEALHTAGLWPDHQVPEAWSNALGAAVQQYLAKTPCQLLVLQLEDVMGDPQQANVPGTVDEHPNWQHKIRVPIEQWPQHLGLMQALAACADERPLLASSGPL
ncbi:MAG: 4-alpha-glucanotransferase [Vampirovibrionales bacterium]